MPATTTPKVEGVPQHGNGHETSLAELTKNKIKQITAGRGVVHRAFASLRRRPRTEISQDWQAVSAFASAAAEYFAASDPTHDNDVDVLATVMAYLECARTEPDFAEAWSLVNLADAFLPLVVADHDLDRCTVRLRIADERMEDAYREILGRMLQRSNDGVGLALAEMLKDPHRRSQAFEMLKTIGPAAAAAAPALRRILVSADPDARELASKVLEHAAVDPSSVPNEQPDERHRLHAEQLARTFLWNMMNRHVSLKLALWRTILIQLVVGIVAAIAAIVVLRLPGTVVARLPGIEYVPGLREPLAVILLGFFGGALSAFLTARDAVVEIPSYQLIKRHTSLRMTLGAAGALVVYVVARALGSNAVQEMLRARSFGFIATAITAGFSERLFVSAIEKAAENLHLTGTTKKAAKKPKEKKKPGP